MTSKIIDLATQVGSALQAKGLLLVTAESCTGGGVAQATKKKSRPHLSLAACSCCGEGALAGEATPWLRRCRHCREVTYCSARCASQHARQHAAAHARRHVPFPVGCGRPDFLSEADFKDFTPFA